MKATDPKPFRQFAIQPRVVPGQLLLGMLLLKVSHLVFAPQFYLPQVHLLVLVVVKTAKRIFEHEFFDRKSQFHAGYCPAKLSTAPNWPKLKSVINNGESLSVFLSNHSLLATGAKYPFSYNHATQESPKFSSVGILHAHPVDELPCNYLIPGEQKPQSLMTRIVNMFRGATKHVHELWQAIDASKIEQQQAALKLSQERSHIKRILPSHLHLQETLGDGNCLFRALARGMSQFQGGEIPHDAVRSSCVSEILSNSSLSARFLNNTELEHYTTLARDGTYGDELYVFMPFAPIFLSKSSCITRTIIACTLATKPRRKLFM